jgi:predicted outer membrane repeat protein
MGVGGAVFNSVNGTLHVSDCYFASNISDKGGAIANFGAMTINTPAGRPKSEFLGNTTSGGGFGGAIFTGAIAPLATADIQHTIFTDNVAGGDNPGRLATFKGGAIATNAGGLMNIAHCTFNDNRAQDGGAIYADGLPAQFATLTVSDTAFTNNFALNILGRGGAVIIGDLNAHFTRCAFNSNSAETEGGAIFQDMGQLTLDTCTFVGNTALGPFGSHDIANLVVGGSPSTVFLINTSAVVVLI